MADSNRAYTPFTNEHFIAFCEEMLGQPYWYGTCIYKASTSRLAGKTNQYPQHYGSSRTARYKQDIAAKKVVADCVGACKGYAWTGGGVGVIESIGTDKTFTNKHASNGCPDHSANGMFAYAKKKGVAWGEIGTLPEIVGLALHKDGHIGYYAGNGYAIEWRGFSYGCVKTKVSGRGWRYWYELPFINYGDTPDGTLKRGSKGADVTALQNMLLSLGYALPVYGADGDFGSETENAVKAFQSQNNLVADGVAGEKTLNALKALQPSPDKKAARVLVTGGTVNVRTAPGTHGAIVAVVRRNDTLDYAGDTVDGWYHIMYNGVSCYISGKYSSLTD